MNRYIAVRNELHERIGDELRLIATFQFEEDCHAVAKSMNEKSSRTKAEEPEPELVEVS